MESVALLRNQLTGVHGLYREIVGGLTAEDWTAQPYPGGNPVGFLAWHIAATRDWAIQTWCQGLPAMRASTPFNTSSINPPSPPFGMPADGAVAIARATTPATVLAYADAVHVSAMTLLDGLTDAGLDGVPDARAFNTRVSHQLPGYLEEIDDMYDNPIWRTLTGPCYGHARGHIGEIIAVVEMLRSS